MERKKSVLAATIVSAMLLTGAVAYAASSGVLDGRDDNVGNLQPTASEQRDVTVFVDPVTGSVSATAPTAGPTTTAATAVTAPTTTRRGDPAVSTTRTTIDDRDGDRDDRVDDDNSGPGSNSSGSGSSGSDDRRHGRDSDDD